MTRQLNIDKMKLDAAKAIREVLSATDSFGYLLTGIDPDDIRAIRRNEIARMPLEKLHNILGRLTPE